VYSKIKSICAERGALGRFEILLIEGDLKGENLETALHKEHNIPPFNFLYINHDRATFF
jgi:hypothetical protein